MKIRLYLIILVLICLTLTGCRSDNTELLPGSIRPYTVWFSDPRDYNTNILSVAQAETPFTLVFPSYLPEGINPFPQIAGRAREEFDNEESVTITYKGAKSGDDMIIIEEYNLTYNVLPNDEDTYLSYSNIQVLEQESNGLDFNSEGKLITVVGYHYDWNMNGISFGVTVYEYERDEARRIVQSMIE
jgi:hypothetical protein